MTERLPRSESSAEERELINKLREGDPGAKEILIEWCTREEAEAERSTEAGEAARANIKLDIKKGKLFKAAGLLDAAAEAFEMARYAANNEGESALDLHEEATTAMEEMENE
jgi:hypothetical protein